MKWDKIKSLLEKYYAGESSLEEEEQLRNELNNPETLPEEIQADAEMFIMMNALASEKTDLEFEPEEEGKVVGFISLMGNEVGAIFIMPTCQGRGIGTQLMDHVTGFHRELEVEVFAKNTIGRAFYEKYGFSSVKEYIHEETNQSAYRLRISFED